MVQLLNRHARQMYGGHWRLTVGRWCRTSVACPPKKGWDCRECTSVVPRLHGLEKLFGGDWRLLITKQGSPPHSREDVEVKEMHHTQHEQHQTDLGAQALDRLRQVGG